MEKKIKIILLLMVLSICFGTAMKTTGVLASPQNKQVKWKTRKSVVISKKDIKYYAYLSNDKKQSWIYKIKVKKKVKKLVIPKKIKNAPVTRVGFGKELFTGDMESGCNVFGEQFDFMHGYSFESQKNKNTITEIQFPKTVKWIDEGAFYGMKQLENVKIPNKVEILDRYTFSKCPSLKTVVFPEKMQDISCYAFGESDNVSKISISPKCKKYTVKDGFVIDKKKKSIVWVVSAKKDVVVPDTVVSIGDSAFATSRAITVSISKSIQKIGYKALSCKTIQNVSIDSENAKYVMQDNCIFTKEDATLAAVLVTGKEIRISDKVKIIGENISVMGNMELSDKELLDDDKNFSVHIPVSVEKVMHWWIFFDSADVYFYGMKPPVIVSKYDKVSNDIPTSNRVYVPKGAKEAYLQWAKDQGVEINVLKVNEF